MNKRGHVLNAILLSIGIGYVLQPTLDLEMVRTMGLLLLPITLGALFPDVDTAFGKHRKTLHNLLVLALFAAWPLFFDNLHYVWIGILTHYILDVVGSTRGIALWYPLSSNEWNLPVGIPVASRMTDVATILITVLEVVAFAAALHYAVPVVEPYWGDAAAAVEVGMTMFV